jgi:hypothetical protein
MQEITRNGAKQMIVRLNQLASRLSDLISETNQRRQSFKPAEGEPAAELVQFTDEQRGSYQIALRELEHIREGRPQADNLRAQEAFTRAEDELAAGVAALEPQTGSEAAGA